MPAEELAEIEKQAGLDTTTEAQSELDVFNAGQEVELKSDLSQPEAAIPEVTPEVEPVIPVADESGLLDDTNIPEDVKVGDTLVVFDPKGNPVEVEVEAISDAGSIRVNLPEGEIDDPISDDPSKALINSGRWGTINPRNTNYVTQSAGLPNLKQGTRINELNDEELNESYKMLKERVDDAKSEGIDLETPLGQSGQAVYRLIMTDLSAIEFEINRRKEIAKDTLGEVIKAIDEPEDVTETTTEPAEAAPEVTVEEEVKEKTAKPKKAKPAKRIDLNQKITNPVNKKSVDVGFADEESARVYGDGQIQTKRLVDKKTKKVINESAAFRKNVKNNLGIGTQQYRELNNRYTDYIKKGADDAMKGNQPEFKPMSFANYVNQEIGVPTQGDIVQTLKDKNISTTDSDFKKYLKQQWRVDSLDKLNTINRREVMRTMGSLPMMDQKNTPIAKAFGVQGDNLKIATKQSSIDAQSNKLKNKYTTQELITLAKSSGVPDQQIYSQTEGKPFVKTDIARAIATKEVDLLTSAEEMRDRVASIVTPNVIVRKNRLSNKDKAASVVRYNIEFPDKKKISIPVDNRLDDAQAREFAANLALEERVAELKKENQQKKAVPEAADRDYLDAVRYMLASGNNPLGILQQIAKPKYSTTNRIEGETSDIPLPSLAVLREPSYLFKSGVDVDNIALNLKKLTKRMFPDADVALVDRLFTPEGEKAGLTDIRAENLILISLDKKFADPTDTLYHEAFHWFSNNGFFSNEDMNALRENESIIRNIADARVGQPVESFEEAAAIASGAYNNAKINGQIPYEFLPPIRRVFDKLYRFFNKFKQFLNRKKYRTPEDVFDRMREGDLFEEMSKNQVPLNKVNESFVKKNFQTFGDVGKYEGGQMIQQTIPQYQYLQGMQPFWVNSKSFERPANFMFDSTNLRIFQNDALLERIEGLKTKKTKASEWIRQIFPTKRPIKQAYDQDVGLKDWLENQKEAPVSKQTIIDYYNANADMYSIVVSGKDLDFFPVVNADERIAYQEVNNEISLLQHLTQKNNDQIRMLAMENTRFYRALKENFYDGPNNPLDTAFYSGVQTDKVINAWKKETRGKDFPLDVSNKDFDHLRKAFNSDIANYDFQTNPEMQDKTAKIVEKMLNPFVKTKEVEGGWSIAVADVKDTDLAKFLSDLQGASELYIDKDGEVQVTYVHVNFDTVLDYINKFSNPAEIEYFVNHNNLGEADGSLYNYGQLLKDNLYLQEKYKLFDDLRSNPEVLDTPAGLEITYQKFNSLQANPDYGNIPVSSITAIDSIFGPMQRVAVRQAAKMKGQDLPKTTRELAELSGDTFETPILASPSEFGLAGDIRTQTQRDIEQLTPDEREAFRLSWNNLRTDDYSIIRFIHTPSDLSQQPYMNGQHFNAIPGAFAHARIRNIYLPDGEKILFIEEIQSDYLNDLKQALNSKFEGRELKDVSAEEIDQAFKDGLLLSTGKEQKVQKNIQQIPLLKLADGKPDFINSYQDMITRAITKIALDNHYDGIATINENLQAERITESITEYFDNLYYMASVNPYDIELKEVDGIRFFYHKPSGQSVSVLEVQESDFFTPADNIGEANIGSALAVSNRNSSGFMAAANLFAQKFSRNPESYEHNTYVRYARLIGMQGANIATDMAVPTDLSVIQANPEGADNGIMHHEATTHLRKLGNPLIANYFKGFKGKVGGDQRNNIKTLGSFLPKSNNPSSPSFGDIITQQIRLGVTPDFKRANVSSLSGNEVITGRIREVDRPSSMTGFDPNRLLYQQDNLQGIGNGYFNLRSISPELVRGFMKQGFTQYGDPMFSRLQKALNVVDNGKGYSIAGKTKNEIAAELFDGAKIKDINSNDWWANRLFSETYKGMEGRFPEVIEVTEREENQGLSRRQFLKTVIAGTALVNVPKSLVPVDTIRKHIERIGGLDSIMYENHPIDYIEDLKSMLIDDQETGENTGLEILKDLYETMEVPFTQEELLQENGESEKFVSTYRRYREVMEPYLDIALDSYTKKQEKQKQERIREETEDVVYDELSQPEQNQVAMAKMQAQMEVNSKFGVKPAAKEWGGRDTFEVQGDRFRFPTIIFDEGFTDQFGSQKGGAPFAKYSSTPADAQRAHTVMNTLDKGRNLTKYFSGVGRLPNHLKYLKERYLTFGRMGQAEDAAKFLYNQIGEIVNPTKGKDTPERQKLRRELTEFMEGGWNASPEMISDSKLRKLAIKSKSMIDNVGKLLVNKGLLPRDVYEKNKGTYLPRLYMKHILDHPNGQPLSYTKKRKDLDTETRVMLGDIADISPEFRIYAGITRPLRDIAMLDFFETVSNDQGWALKDKDIMVQVPTPDGKPMNVSALWLRQEADRLMEQANSFDTAPDLSAQMRDKAEEFYEISRPVLVATNDGQGQVIIDGKPAKDWRRIPATKKYGMLQGVAVRKEIYNDIIGTFTIGDTDNFYNKSIAAMKKGVNIWKTLKVPLNPPTVVRNVGSNMILMNIVGGVPIHKVLPRMKQAIDQIRNDGAAWKIAKKYGIKSTGFSEQELYQTSEEMLDLMQQQHELGDITKFFALPKILGQKILKKGGDLYQFTESVGKTAIIIDAMDKGMGEFEAFHLAQKALFDYSDLPAGGKAFRSAPIGMPFFTFYYKAFPALIEVALTNPMRFAPYVALTAGLSALTGFAFGFEDDDDKKLKKSLEPWIERRTGVHVLPWKDSDGRFQFIDIGYFFPWTMYADAVKGAYNGEFMELQRTTGLFSGPFSDILLAMKTNRDPFTQRVIWDERDPVEERIKSLMWYTYGIGMPSWLTPNGAISKTVKALQDTPRPTGQPADTVPQALLRFVGVNLYGLEPKETRLRNIKRMNRDIEDTTSRMRWTMRNQSLDQETKNARKARYLSLIRQKQQEKAQYMHDTSLPESLLNRKSRFQD